MEPLASHLLPDTAMVDPTGALTIGGCSTIELAAEYGTPLYVYDEHHLRTRCRQTVAAFGGGAIYAAKAFWCRALARLVYEEGMRVDVATGGELHIAMAGGIPAASLVLHGNNKTVAELETAVNLGVGRIVVDSFDELDRLDQLAPVDGRIPVMLRLTPGVEADTHHHIATGQDDSKFGFTVSTGAAARAVDRVRGSQHLDLRGIHCHIGSQLLRLDGIAAAVTAMAAFGALYGLPELAVGGGLGVAYTNDQRAPSIPQWAAVIKDAAREAGVTAQLIVEPGRAIVATAAITLYTVGTIKELPGIRTYVAVDGGISDNPRPAMYGSRYEVVLPRAAAAKRDRPVRLVGMHCETGDILVREGHLPADLGVGDLVATPVTGAYTQAMSSNYNKALRPAVVFVAEGKARLVIRRETYQDLLATDIG